MSVPVECPHCGFINLHSGSECARCRKPLPERKDLPPVDEQSDSQTDISGTENQVAMPPKMEPEEAEPLTEDSAMDTEAEDIKEAETTAAPEQEQTITDEIGVEAFHAPVAPQQPAKPEAVEQMEIFNMKKAPLLDEESLTYTGSDTELREISKFFKRAKKDREAPPGRMEPKVVETVPEEPSPAEEPSEDSISKIEISPPSDISGPQPADESSDSFKPDFSESPLLTFGEDASSQTTGVRSGPEAAAARAPLSAPVFPRALAGAVDMLIYAVIFMVLYTGASWAGHLDEVSLSLGQWVAKVLIPLVLMMTVIFIFSETFFALTSGQTPGQIIFGLKTMDEDGDPVSFSQALIRAAVYLVLIMPLGLPLIITILLGKDHRGAHEQLSGTIINKI